MIDLAGCIIYRREDGEKVPGEFWVLHRNTDKLTQWELPGGKVDPGETPEQAAVRELKEELLVDVQIIRSLGNAAFSADERDWNYHWFEAEIVGDSVPAIGEPTTFDNLALMHVDELRERSDLSLNITNLLATETFQVEPPAA